MLKNVFIRERFVMGTRRTPSSDLPFPSLVQAKLLLHEHGVDLPFDGVVQDLLVSSLDELILKHKCYDM